MEYVYHEGSTLQLRHELMLGQCNPREKLWKPETPGYCFSTHQLGVASGILNVLSDFSILILPIPVVWHLHMAGRKKIAVVGVFSVGLFACTASILRLVYSIELLSIPAGSVEALITIDTIGVWRYKGILQFYM